MHLWDGLILFERTRSILFSSDLFGQFGKVEKEIINSEWEKQIAGITTEKIPSPTAFEKMQKELIRLPVSIIAPGHGACIKV